MYDLVKSYNLVTVQIHFCFDLKEIIWFNSQGEPYYFCLY